MHTATALDHAFRLSAPHIALVPAAAAGALARIGTLEARLATTEADRQAAFRLRHGVFVREGGARIAGTDIARKIETDSFDAAAHHIVVRDLALRDAAGQPLTVGTYRALLPAARHPDDGCAAAHFDLAPMLAARPGARFCEVGRSCIAPSHRSLLAIDVLWCGLWAFAVDHGVDVLFGAASFPGTDPVRHAAALRYLAAQSPCGSAVSAHPHVAVDPAALPEPEMSHRTILRALPPLIRGYLRVGATFSATAAIDRAFGTVDLLVMTPMAGIPRRYKSHFERVTGRALACDTEAVPFADRPGCVGAPVR